MAKIGLGTSSSGTFLTVVRYPASCLLPCPHLPCSQAISSRSPNSIAAILKAIPGQILRPERKGFSHCLGSRSIDHALTNRMVFGGML
ncbi:unnamed protein product [Brassica oleracea var. botrytis]|uniref:(rape) hypothetical protein n=1 Tax=Brassica napus TaxID=3708 RepID=A0A816UYQ1_BRANA|nr:unnamed protein product [Brassica napus]